MADNIKKSEIAGLISIVIITFIVVFILKFLICLSGWALICAIMGWTFEVPHALCVFIFSFIVGGVNVNTKVEE